MMTMFSLPFDDKLTPLVYSFPSRRRDLEMNIAGDAVILPSQMKF